MYVHISISHIHFVHREPYSHVMRAFVLVVNTHLWTIVEKHKGSTDARVVTITISLKLMIMEQVNLYITRWHKGNLSGASRNRDDLHKPVIRTQCYQATCKTSYQLLLTENETIKQHDLSVRGKKTKTL